MVQMPTMRKIFILTLLFISTQVSSQQDISLPTAKFKTGDIPAWSQASFDDSQWPSIKTNTPWEQQGYADYNGFAWYRFHFKLPASLRDNSYWKDSLRIFLAKIDDVDEVFINGVKIGQKGSFPENSGGYSTAWNETREYHLSTKHPALQWDKDNVIAVRVYDGGGAGGIFSAIPFVNMMDLIDGVKMNLHIASTRDDKNTLTLVNNIQKKIYGKLSIVVTDPGTDTLITQSKKDVELVAGNNFSINIPVESSQRATISAVFREQQTGKSINTNQTLPYILTPPPPATPRINGAKVLGARPGSPIYYKIAATGEKPLHYTAENLPAELSLDRKTGIITGKLTERKDYHIKLVVINTKGNDKRDLTIKVGDVLALTPPMGWNSWNCWGLSVSDEKVKASAQALIDKGLIDHGWTFMNIDDGWEAEKRQPDNMIAANKKFPDMKGLGDWLHGNGLKFGIYSSPGPRTCGGYLGSYKNELNDAITYSNWGIDYLKYDWCSYGNIAGKDTSLAGYEKPYFVMRDALQKQPRDIVFSLCQYGMKDVWKWGPEVNGNLWRTTGDIEDTWQSLSNIGFHQTKQFAYAKPGRWNDPDMLIVGQVGWGENLHPTRLTPDEQYTHISLWCLLSAPLLIGCDISKMDDFTLNLLTNDEVIAVDQDPLGKQAQQIIATDNVQVWMKELEDGSKALGIFNLSGHDLSVSVNWNDLGLHANQKVHDLWRQKDLGSFKDSFSTKVASHGVTLVKVGG